MVSKDESFKDFVLDQLRDLAMESARMSAPLWQIYQTTKHFRIVHKRAVF